ncbi:MAG: ABC transporter permease [Anaerovibrio sp.]|uniref:ABC transporter permease n=1 Tax=Anaerovibrio sp. TaxID=1872532 RepID=UPI0025CD67AF|nr:ABC transporter permease [Anaerovibrio sp.]MCR5176914.1 ABC transporter permease [Anaerovibrio sp.]
MNCEYDFSPISQDDNSAAVQSPGKPMGYWQDAWIRLKRDRAAMMGMIFIILMTISAILIPMFSGVSYADQDFAKANLAPSMAHFFGTDGLGRDMFIRVLYGARISLSIGIVASLINLVIGVIYGGISGFIGGRTDRIMMNIVDILYSIPTILYVILLMVVFKPGLMNIFIALGISYWLQMARIVRGEVLKIKEQEFVLAAKSMGAGQLRILFRHLIPNSVGVIIVSLSLSIPDAIFTEAFLSFIGLGVSAPMASWGVLCSDGINSIRAYPFQLFFPAVAISLTMLAFNFFSDGLRDALDPRMRR